jgi:hypothetical protein
VKSILCPHCVFVVNARLEWQRFANGTLHLRAMCTRPECGRFIKFVEQTPKALAAAGDPPPVWDDEPSLFEDKP